MKKNVMMRLSALLLVAVLLTTCVISGTFAKYTSTVSGNDTAKVAKWAWEYNGGSLQASSPLTFDLFNTINDTAGGAEESDVADNLIAPGTQGSFMFTFNNQSEVNATVSVNFSSSEEVAPIKYSLDGTEWKETIAELFVENRAVAMGGSTTVTVLWKWAFEETDNGWNDTSDTALGLNPVNHTVTATVVFKQVD